MVGLHPWCGLFSKFSLLSLLTRLLLEAPSLADSALEILPATRRQGVWLLRQLVSQLAGVAALLPLASPAQPTQSRPSAAAG